MEDASVNQQVAEFAQGLSARFICLEVVETQLKFPYSLLPDFGEIMQVAGQELAQALRSKAGFPGRYAGRLGASEYEIVISYYIFLFFFSN